MSVQTIFKDLLRELRQSRKSTTKKEYRQIKADLRKFFRNPGQVIEYHRREMLKINPTVPTIAPEILDAAVSQWQAAVTENDSHCPIYRDEERLWKQVDPSLKYLGKIPFFLIGIDHPLKQPYPLDPEEEAPWLSVRKAYNLARNEHGCCYYRSVSNNYTQLSEVHLWLRFLDRLNRLLPNIIEARWRPIPCDFPSYFNHSSQYLRSWIWNIGQRWCLGPVVDSDRVIYVKRLDNHYTSSFREIRMEVKDSLAEQLSWDNLVAAVAEDLPRAIQLSEKFHYMTTGRIRFPFHNLTPELVRSLQGQEPNPEIDDQLPQETFRPEDTSNMVRRLTQDWGSRIIINWILSNQGKNYYLRNDNECRPISAEYAKNLLRNCCVKCGHCFSDDYETPRISWPVAYNIYTNFYGYNSRFDYEEISFFFDPDEDNVGEFCDDCIVLQIAEGKAFSLSYW